MLEIALIWINVIFINTKQYTDRLYPKPSAGKGKPRRRQRGRG
jgi:hypothetical protein